MNLKMVTTSPRQKLVLSDSAPHYILTVMRSIGSGSLTLNSFLKLTAGVDLGGNRVVVLNDSGLTIYADKDIYSHIFKILGITTGSTVNAGTATVQTYGEMIEPSWAWTPGLPIYVGTNGLLTQTIPNSGFICQIGFAETATKIFIDLKTAIKL